MSNWTFTVDNIHNCLNSRMSNKKMCNYETEDKTKQLITSINLTPG